MSLVLYYDQSSPDWKAYKEVFDAVSNDLMLKEIQFYFVDARAYPELEDTRLLMAITRFREPRPSYLVCMHQGRI